MQRILDALEKAGRVVEIDPTSFSRRTGVVVEVGEDAKLERGRFHFSARRSA